MRKNPCYTTNSFVNFNVKNNVFCYFCEQINIFILQKQQKIRLVNKKKIKK